MKVPSDIVQGVLDRMDSKLDVAAAPCVECHNMNLISGVRRVGAFICQFCGEGNVI
jgi:hypothetical protein